LSANIDITTQRLLQDLDIELRSIPDQYQKIKNEKTLEKTIRKSDITTHTASELELTSLAKEFMKSDVDKYKFNLKEYKTAVDECLEIIGKYFSSSTLLAIRDTMAKRDVSATWRELMNTYARISTDGLANVESYIESMPCHDVNKFARMCNIVFDLQESEELEDGSKVRLPDHKKFKPWKITERRLPLGSAMRSRFDRYLDKIDTMTYDDWIPWMIGKESEEVSLMETIRSQQKMYESNSWN
jgi:hypothetical protein